MKNAYKKILLIVLFLFSICLESNTTDNIERLSEFGNYSYALFNKTINYSKPIFSPIPSSSIKKSLVRCSNIGFRAHPIYKAQRMHKGIDLPADTGTEVISTMHGDVIFAGYKENGYGNQIEIVSGDYMIRYAHLHTIDITTGSKVKFGEKIATVGSTGRSTGPHLHYEIHKKGFIQDPIKYITGDIYK